MNSTRIDGADLTFEAEPTPPEVLKQEIQTLRAEGMTWFHLDPYYKEVYCEVGGFTCKIVGDTVPGADTDIFFRQNTIPDSKFERLNKAPIRGRPKAVAKAVHTLWVNTGHAPQPIAS